MLKGITAGCALVTTRESVFIGMVGAWLANISAPLLVWLRVDDAVGATCVHGKLYSDEYDGEFRSYFKCIYNM